MCHGQSLHTALLSNSGRTGRSDRILDYCSFPNRPQHLHTHTQSINAWCLMLTSPLKFQLKRPNNIKRNLVTWDDVYILNMKLQPADGSFAATSQWGQVSKKPWDLCDCCHAHSDGDKHVHGHTTLPINQQRHKNFTFHKFNSAFLSKMIFYNRISSWATFTVTGKRFTPLCIQVGGLNLWVFWQQKVRARVQDADSKARSVFVCIKKRLFWIYSLELKVQRKAKTYVHTVTVKESAGHLSTALPHQPTSSQGFSASGGSFSLSKSSLTDCTTRRQVVQSKLLNEKLFWLDQNNRSSGYSVMLSRGEK